ncbi:MAG: deoxyuridine 5'-triphosphate nucleotidohydrolase [Chloroflexia bacterium]|nr:deoxyuridine 5'-triphosphate nucleotidohydrolase [Chloroflexia bacterium]
MTPEGDLSRIGGVLGREEILDRIQGSPPLVSGYLALDDQLQPNGFDLSLAEIGSFASGGAIGRDNATRKLPNVETLPFDERGWLDLRSGPYQLVFNETVHLPNGLMALGRPRSSVCRNGATIVTAVWDAGYRGRSTALLVVENPAGIRIERDARLMQLVFFTLNEPTSRGYDGAYQGENLPVDRSSQSRRA